MKKILFAAFAATLLAAGCQKTEIFGTTPTNGPEMTFSTEMKKITKADPSASAVGDANLQAQGFNVWAYADYDVTNSANVGPVGNYQGIYDGIADLHVTYDDADPNDNNPGWWNPGKEYYWPGASKNLRFYAVSATINTDKKLNYTVNINQSCPNYLKTETKASDDYELQVVDFAVNSSSPNEDLMVADFITQNQQNKTVDLHFHHTLAKVEFLFKTATSETVEAKQPKVYVQKITVSGMQTKGTLNVAPSTSGSLTAPTSFTWVPSTENSDVKIFSSTSEANDIILNANEQMDYLTGENYTSQKGLKLIPTITSADGNISGTAVEPARFVTWLMMPQTLAEKKVEIIYVINNRQFKAIFDLATTEITEWAVNSYTKYTVSLLPNLISFTATSRPWTPTDGNGIEHQN